MAVTFLRTLGGEVKRMGLRKELGLVLGLLALASLLATPVAAQNKLAATAEAPSGKALGSRGAPVTVEVFSDFQCPACRALYQSTLRPLIDNYVTSGKVYLVHRDFPLENTHKHARQAARYANAAAKIGRFEKAADALYARQDFWAVDGNLDAALALVMTPAEMKKIRQLVQQSARLDADIDQDVRLGGKIPVRSTPTVVVLHRGKSYPLPAGGVSYSLLKQFIDDLLRQ